MVIKSIYWLCFIQALHHLLLCPTVHEAEGIDMAIKVVSEAKQEALTQRLIDYLIGDVDATPKVCVHRHHEACHINFMRIVKY